MCSAIIILMDYEEFSVETFFVYMPKEILMDTILEDFTDSEKIPLSLVSKSFWDLFQGDTLHFVTEEFYPLTISLIEFFNKTKVKKEIHELLCPAAAMHGDLELLKWARLNNYPWNEATTLLAAKYDHLEVLKWAHSEGCPWDADVTLYATKKGHLEVLKWAIWKACSMHNKCAMIAAERGYFEIVKLFHTNGMRSRSICAGAARGGYIEILQWLLYNGGMWNVFIVSKELVINGHLHILKWCREHNFSFHKKIYDDAIEYDYIEIIKWLEEIGYPRK